MTFSFLTKFPFDQLIHWYDQQEILPWQETTDPYLVWTSEIMLQQTTVPVVRQRYALWLAEFPTLISLAQADLQQVLKAFEGLGYYARARNLHKAAIWIAEHGWPTDAMMMRRLPGLGDYTTKTLLSRCFNQPVLAFDVNIERFFARILLKFPLTKHDQKHIEETLVPQQHQYKPEIFGQAIMRFAQSLCKKRDPQCAECFLKDQCRAYKEGQQMALFPAKVKKKVYLENYMIILQWQDQILIEKRIHGIGKGMYSFPRVSPADYEALSLLVAQPAREFDTVTHTYTHHVEKLYPRVFAIEKLVDWDFGPQCQFFNQFEVKSLPFLSVYRDILRKIDQRGQWSLF